MKSIVRMTSTGVEDGRTAFRLRSGVHVMGAALGLLLASPTSFLNAIQALEPTGFKVGSDVTVNQLGTTYHWMAFGDSVPAGPPPPPKPKIIKWVEVDPYGP